MKATLVICATLLAVAFLVSPTLGGDGRIAIYQPRLIDAPGGYTVTRNVVSSGDGAVLTIDCLTLGDGLVEIDLNGFELRGGASVEPVILVQGEPSQLCQLAVRNGALRGGGGGIRVDPPGMAWVRIEDVTIDGAQGDGIYLDEVGRFELRRVTVSGAAGLGVSVVGAIPGKIGVVEDSSIWNPGADGILIDFALGVNVARNRVLGAGGSGIVLSSTSSSAILENEVVVPTDYGVLLEATTSGCTVSRNRIGVSGLEGILVDESSSDNRVVENTVRGAASDGIRIAGDRNQIVDNLTNSNLGYGLRFYDPSGAPPFSVDNTFGGNSAQGNAGTGCAGGSTGAELCDDNGPIGFENFSYGNNLLPGPIVN